MTDSIAISPLQDVSNVFGLLSRKPAIVDGTKQLEQKHGTDGVAVDVEGVTFAYEQESQVLSDVSLRIEPGQTLGICGASGSGKSTLLRLLLRMHDPTRGSIRMDGIDLRDLHLSSLKNHVSLIEQSASLFNDTLLNNIRYARPNATREEVLDAVQAAELQHLLDRLPEGLDSNLGDGGLALSGGERQRVAIARVRICFLT